MKQSLFILALLLIFACSQPQKKQVDESTKLPLLKVSENNRYLMTEDGDPFFWLGDTGWLLFGKLSREEADKYLQDRVEKGFNVIQIMVLHSLEYESYYGDKALIDNNVAKPLVTEGSDFNDPEQYDFWDHADYVINLAAEKGLYVGLVPVWGSNVKNGGVSTEEAAVYAKWIANRYKDNDNVIWLNGGDTFGSDSTRTWNALGAGIDAVVGDRQLITFHPRGRTTSSIWFHNEDWLDFNMFQSGHRRYDQDDTEWNFGEDNWRYVEHDLAMEPLKPTIDGEPSYEGIPQGLHDTLQPFWNDADARRYAYWSVFAGAFGYTYGNSAVMQFYRLEDEGAAYGAKEYWDEAIDMPGAGQMQYLKTLMLSKPFFERVPDQSLIASGQGEKYDYQVATRGKNYAMLYTYNGREIHVAMGKIAGENVNAWWFNPRNGELTTIGDFENTGVQAFDPPGEVADGNDWVLVLNSIG
ncbi:glycoside hydrolase family 140 protein [Maribellus mangrovi]|uniref:glycoside hydrolase family 140 protein n=1 Tax=Maribellus mangrovi TaxID=3133146 RepID=UPI0030EBD65B